MREQLSLIAIAALHGRSEGDPVESFGDTVADAIIAAFGGFIPAPPEEEPQ